MKYGIVIHRPTANIGDDIQTYAAKMLLPKVDYLIERESIHQFTSENNEPVATIMSGWYMFKKWNWPPSQNIIPLFLGFHYSNHARTQMGYEYLTNGVGREYMQMWAPIGCRDLFTKRQLQKAGVDAYFSGCVTLTLPKTKRVATKEYICLVDVKDDIKQAVRQQLQGTGIDIKEITHRVPSQAKVPWEKREEAVKALLTVYQNAKCVLSSRIHCTLPCIAMGVPVLHLGNSIDEQRFLPYVDLVHYSTRTNFINGESGFSLLSPPIMDRPELSDLSENIKKTVSDFVEAVEMLTPQQAAKLTSRISKTEIDVWRNQMMKKTLSALQNQLNKFEK